MIEASHVFHAAEIIKHLKGPSNVLFWTQKTRKASGGMLNKSKINASILVRLCWDVLGIFWWVPGPFVRQ